MYGNITNPARSEARASHYMTLRSTLLFVLILAAAAPANAALPRPVAAALRAADLPSDAIGVVVQRLRDGRTVVSHRARASMQPASTLKLLTSLAALEILGPAYRGRSELRARADVADGVLAGDLALAGLGDMDLDWRAFEGLLRRARQQGIREIRGDLVLDRSFFAPARSDLGLAPFDETPEFRYNVIPDALLLNTNLVQLELFSDGNAVRVAMAPELDGVTVEPRFTLVQRDCDRWEDGWIAPEVEETHGALVIRLRGEFPVDCAASTEINVLDRLAFADRLFRSSWRRLGGTFSGRTREGSADAGARTLAEHRSRPLSEVTRDINKRSDNPITRTVFLTLGALSFSPSSLPTSERAALQLRDWLARRGIGAEGLVLENGSGLSRRERIRPLQLAAVLRAGARSEWAPEFLASLPIVAIDGAMRKRLGGSPAAGRARIKTGTLRDVAAIAGYVKDSAGETYVVVAMINHERATRELARPILDSLVDWVARRR